MAAFNNDLRELLVILKAGGKSALRLKRSPDYRRLRQQAEHYMDTGADDNWRAIFKPLITGLVIDRAGQMSAALGFQFDVQNLYARDWFNNYMLTFAQEINTTTKLGVATVINSGQRLGASIPQMQSRLQGLFEYYLAGGSLTEDEIEWYTSRLPNHRAENIARTETIRASNAGSHEIHKMWGVQFKEWIATFDDRVRPEHAQAGREYVEGGEIGPIPIDRPFIVGGVAMMYPGDPAGTPAMFCNCRCTTAPWLPKDVDGEPIKPEPVEPAVEAPVAVEAPRPEPTQPEGLKPVSEALKLPKSGKMAKHYKRALDAIDSVHGDGDLPEIPIKTNSQMRSFGRLNSRWKGKKDGWVTEFIEVNGKKDHPELTSVHEIGHFLDNHGMAHDIANWGATDNLNFGTIWDDYIRALNNSDWMKTAMRMSALPEEFAVEVSEGALSWTAQVDQRHLRYLTSSREIWARSYAQYIATKSGDEVLLAQLADRREEMIYGMINQWDEDDFKPILKAIDGIFEKLGWIR